MCHFMGVLSLVPQFLLPGENGQAKKGFVSPGWWEDEGVGGLGWAGGQGQGLREWLELGQGGTGWILGKVGF